MLAMSKYGKNLYVGNIFLVDQENYNWSLKCHGNENMKKLIDPLRHV